MKPILLSFIAILYSILGCCQELTIKTVLDKLSSYQSSIDQLHYELEFSDNNLVVEKINGTYCKIGKDGYSHAFGEHLNIRQDLIYVDIDKHRNTLAIHQVPESKSINSENIVKVNWINMVLNSMEASSDNVKLSCQNDSLSTLELNFQEAKNYQYSYVKILFNTTTYNIYFIESKLNSVYARVIGYDQIRWRISQEPFSTSWPKCESLNKVLVRKDSTILLAKGYKHLDIYNFTDFKILEIDE